MDRKKEGAACALPPNESVCEHCTTALRNASLVQQTMKASLRHEAKLCLLVGRAETLIEKMELEREASLYAYASLFGTIDQKRMEQFIYKAIQDYERTQKLKRKPSPGGVRFGRDGRVKS